MDYEIYNITIKNNNNSAICLTDTKSTNDIYIKDANGVKYGVYNHELFKNIDINNAEGIEEYTIDW